MTRRYEELPENIDQMSDQEIEAMAKSIWQKITAERVSIDRDTQLRLRQQAYSIWRNKYPDEHDDDADCHLEDIHSWLLSEYFENGK